MCPLFAVMAHSKLLGSGSNTCSLPFWDSKSLWILSRNFPFRWKTAWHRSRLLLQLCSVAAELWGAHWHTHLLEGVRIKVTICNLLAQSGLHFHVHLDEGFDVFNFDQTSIGQSQDVCKQCIAESFQEMRRVNRVRCPVVVSLRAESYKTRYCSEWIWPWGGWKIMGEEGVRKP